MCWWKYYLVCVFIFLPFTANAWQCTIQQWNWGQVRDATTAPWHCDIVSENAIGQVSGRCPAGYVVVGVRSWNAWNCQFQCAPVNVTCQ